MNERDFLALAQVLIQMPGEAAWRSAVSRAYYAAFHVARKLFVGMGLTVPQAERAHAYLTLRLQNCGDAQTQQAGADLNTLRRNRSFADYDLHRSLRHDTAQDDVNAAVWIIQALDAAALEPTRSQALAEMVRYERDVLQDVTWAP